MSLPADAPHDLMGTKQVAERLSVDPRTVVRWARNHRIPSYRVGNRWRFSRAEVEHWLINQKFSPGLHPSTTLVPGGKAEAIPGQLAIQWAEPGPDL